LEGDLPPVLIGSSLVLQYRQADSRETNESHHDQQNQCDDQGGAALMAPLPSRRTNICATVRVNG
jgi:hypothetical protein